ncbi:glucose 1-dehydrogenase [Streptomyces sp. YIM 98790]|uniref:glucose 1-dehydrogenase n=1 Tax=Streptomyces sp. YIM 98790 TaxID=2689077 RepID=UPI001409632E|nr:glucose 1-dehydrogenase [Streptomyces sp. YIM 98790]
MTLALTVRPGERDSLEVREEPEPDPDLPPGTDQGTAPAPGAGTGAGTGPEQPGRGGVLRVRGLAAGVCGTDREIASGTYGRPPPGRDRLILGHESLGRVEQAPPDSGFAPGDLVAGVVRRPDPVPCGACARGEFDMCRNGRYTEHGIKELDGWARERWTLDAAMAVRLDPALSRAGVLTEPAGIVAKAWEQIERVGGRSWFEPRRVLVTGAGPIGLLAALLATQRGIETHVLDRVIEGPKPGLVRDLGADYHTGDPEETVARLHPDVIIEATGAGPVVFAALGGTAPYGVVCLTGVSPAGRRLTVDAGSINREIVLENDAVVGSVNANLRHYRQAARDLSRADPAWLERLLSRRVPLARAAEAFTPQPDDVKVVIALEGTAPGGP